MFLTCFCDLGFAHEWLLDSKAIKKQTMLRNYQACATSASSQQLKQQKVQFQFENIFCCLNTFYIDLSLKNRKKSQKGSI